jgi:hypothetical protein
VSKQERKDEHLSDDNTGGHLRLCSCALLTQDGVEQLELARLYREEAQAAPSKVRSPRHSSMGSIRDPCENPARRDPDPATFVPPWHTRVLRRWLRQYGIDWKDVPKIP